MGQPELIGSILKKFQSTNLQQNFKKFQLENKWNEIIDPEAGFHTQVAAFKNNILVIHVDNSSWLYELSLFKKSELLIQISKKCPEFYIKDIKFRIGKVNKEKKNISNPFLC